MKLRAIAAVLFTAVLLAVPTTASAQTAPAPAAADEVAPQVTTFAILGTGIMLTVGVDSTGHLSSVELVDEAGDDLPDAVATKVKPHRVRFVLQDEGVRVEVRAKDHKVESRVKARSLADLVGSHSWSGELFGASNGVTEFSYSVADDGGVPTIELLSLTGPGEYTSSTSQEAENGEVKAKLRVEFVDDDGHEARITVSVEVEDHEGNVEAKLKISVRSDFLGVDEADGRVDDPDVNTPVRDRDDEDHGNSHDDDNEGHGNSHDDDDGNSHDDDDGNSHDDDNDDNERGENHNGNNGGNSDDDDQGDDDSGS